MARRASKGGNKSIIILSLTAIAIFAVAVTVLGKKTNAFSDLSPLPLQDVTLNGNSLRGNSYQVNGKIEERWVRESSEGVHVLVGTDGPIHHLFIKIPKELERPNLEREKRYSFSVEIGGGGIPIATAIKRL